MTIIAEGAGPLDPDRFRLFWRYYDVVARREQTKEKTRFAELLRDHGEQVLDLNERVGLELQRRSETAEGGTATMSQDDLSEIAWHVLADEGYDPAGKDARLLERIVEAATHRLVLLVPRTDGYGFDVRSLQEMMAARRITTGEHDTVLKRLPWIRRQPSYSRSPWKKWCVWSHASPRCALAWRGRLLPGESLPPDSTRTTTDESLGEWSGSSGSGDA
jgi:hypothetical protein